MTESKKDADYPGRPHNFEATFTLVKLCWDMKQIPLEYRENLLVSYIATLMTEVGGYNRVEMFHRVGLKVMVALRECETEINEVHEKMENELNKKRKGE